MPHAQNAVELLMCIDGTTEYLLLDEFAESVSTKKTSASAVSFVICLAFECFSITLCPILKPLNYLPAYHSVPNSTDS